MVRVGRLICECVFIGCAVVVVVVFGSVLRLVPPDQDVIGFEGGASIAGSRVRLRCACVVMFSLSVRCCVVVICVVMCR